MVNWNPYLDSLCNAYAQWWNVYTIMNWEGQKREGSQTSSVLLDFTLMVQTIQPDSQRGGNSQERVERLSILEGLRKYASEHVLLVGRPGSGKSTALARLLLEEAQKERGRKGDGEEQQPLTPSLLKVAGEDLPKIPVLVKLRYYQTSVLSLIQDFLRRHGLWLQDAEIDELLFQGRFLILLDGLNELPSEEARQDLKAFQMDNPHTPMVFTTQDLGREGDLDIDRKLEMQPLTEEQMRHFSLAYLSGQGEEMLRQLGSRLREFGQSPLLLKMLCSVFVDNSNKIPPNLGLMFRQFANRYDRKLFQDVPIANEYRRWCPQLLEHLAWMMTNGNELTQLQVVLSRHQAEAVLIEFLQGKVNCPEDCAFSWIEDLLKHHLIQLGANDQIEFQHQLIQEYYTAECLLKQLPHLIQDGDRLKRDYLNYLKWTPTLALMLELVEDEAQALRVVELALEVDLQLGARLAGAVKPEFQEQTIALIDAREISQELKIALLSITRSDYAIPLLRHTLDNNKGSYLHSRGVEALGKIPSEAAVQALSELLEDEDYYVRLRAIEVLGQIPSEAAVHVLSKVLENEGWFHCQKVIEALDKIPLPTAIQALFKALVNEHHYVRIKAAEALGETQLEIVVEPLIRALEDEYIEVRSKAAEALGKIRSEIAVQLLIKFLEVEASSVRRNAIYALGQIRSEVAIQPLIKLLEDEDNSVRYMAASALGNIPSEAVIQPLIKLLEDEDDSVRLRAVEALGKNPSKVAVQALNKGLEDDDFSVRVRAQKLLGRIPSKAMIQALSKALEDDNSYVRCNAIYALRQISSKAGIELLIKALENKDSEVRWLAVEALNKIPSEAAVQPLAKTLKDEYSDIRPSAVLTLSKIQSEAVIKVLIKALENEDRSVCWRATDELGKNRSKAVIKPLVKALKHENSYVRFSAAEALGKIGSKAAVKPLIKALEDEGDSVRLKAAESLGEIGAKAAVKPLIKALEDEGDSVRLKAAEALGEIRAKAAVKPLIKALEDKYSGVRSSAADVLGEIASPKAMPDLYKHLQNSEGSYLLNPISTLQKRCKFYNYTLTQPSSPRDKEK
ncbi:HEAT repeat domain-containing protein [Trichocoleus sp. DQ-A3]|uniref:HEAT repeat domain-containing protein n=1 Tax=Cyanophyceae TaxID=3028117 RepID=UPI0016855908|nr:HEAT repeat domain-containing protein [Coleofasciculus sp. FACHB-125]MBD1903422.1 HEAT repeat domain-containing protein [Coleofasciculus sp. FACHB-125]